MTKFTLKNGTRVLLSPQKETKAVTVLVLFGAGSRYETEEVAGVSHFLEHMMFKGTTKRPNTFILSQELDAVGAEFNAFTGKDHTGYWIKINSEHLPLALDMLSDMIFNSKLESEEIDREKGTIIEEINMYEDTPTRYIGTMLEQMIYKNNSLGRDIAGYKKTVRALKRADMVKYRQAYYFGRNAVVSIAGNFDNTFAKKNVTKYFGGMASKSNKIGFKKFSFNQKESCVGLKFKETEQAHLMFGFPGYKFDDKNFLPAEILSTIFGGSMSSRLFINIRERHGLCYYIRSSHDSYQDTGSFSIAAGLDKERIFEAIKLIMNEIQQIKEWGVKPEELKKAKEFLKGHTILEMEDSAAVSEWYGRQELMQNKHESPEERIKALMKVDLKQVNNVAKEVFDYKKMNLALIGPFKSDKEFKKIIK